MTREDAVTALVDHGKTREQAEAFIDLMGSAFRRRGWAPGEPLSQEQIGERLDTFLGQEASPLATGGVIRTVTPVTGPPVTGPGIGCWPPHRADVGATGDDQDGADPVTGPRQFRKRPIVIEAIRWKLGTDAITKFIGGEPVFGVDPDGQSWVEIPTLEGKVRAHRGDWIIRGVAGEIYPCRDDIFRQTYEEPIP